MRPDSLWQRWFGLTGIRTPLLALGAFIGSASLRAEDWPGFLGPNGDGRSAEKLRLEKLDDERERIVWRRSAGPGFGGPVIAGDGGFLHHGGDGVEVVERFDLKSGATLWKRTYPCAYRGGLGTGPGPRATPAVADGMIVTFGSEARLSVWKVADGTPLWEASLAGMLGEPETFFGVGSSPLIHAGMVIVIHGCGNQGAVSAFDLKSGKLRWTAAKDSAGYASPIVRDIEGRPTILALARSGLHGIDPQTGAVRFFHRFRARMNASVNAANPVLIGDRVFLSAAYGSGAELLEVRKDRPSSLWKSQEGILAHYNTPVLVEGTLFGIDGRAEGGASLVAAEASSGRKLWSKDGFGIATLLAAGDRLIAAREDGAVELVAADPKGYRSLGSIKVTDRTPVRAAPALSDGSLYLRSEDELIRVRLAAER